MSGYKHFAVVGAGAIGRYIVDTLIEKKDAGVISSISILTRSGNDLDDFVAKGVKVIPIDYNSRAAVQAAFSGFDVVISTIGHDILELQDTLATAAKAAGVKLFVPSEFGVATDDPTAGGIWSIKYAFKQKLKNELKLPYAAFITGIFPDYVFATGFSEKAGFDFIKGELKIPGIGNAVISWTHRVDIGRYVAHVLTTLPKDKIEWRTFRMEGDRVSFNQIANDWKARTGKDVTISHVPRSHFEDTLAKNPDHFMSQLLLALDAGKGTVGKPEEVTNGVFPEWHPKTVIDSILEMYKR